MNQRMRRMGLAALGAAALTMSVGCQGSGAFANLQQTLQQLQDQQKSILEKVEGIEKSIAAIEAKPAPAAAPAAAGAKAPAKPAGPKPGRPDPKETYKVAVGDAHAKGPKDAKITIVEWSDFQ